MTVILNNPRERSRFLRFVVVGLVGAAVDFGVANLLVSLAHFPLWIAGTISFICAILSNFIWNRYWTYPDSRSKQIGRQLLEFSVVSLMGLAIRIPILKLLQPPMENLFGSFGFLGSCTSGLCSAKFLGDNFTLAIAVIIVMFWNFFVNRYWTYSDIE
ncbi:MAG TPA: GtrA family protein [Anaerolineales bacterium]